MLLDLDGEAWLARHDDGLPTVEINYARVMIKNIKTIYNTEGEHVWTINVIYSLKYVTEKFPQAHVVGICNLTPGFDLSIDFLKHFTHRWCTQRPQAYSASLDPTGLGSSLNNWASCLFAVTVSGRVMEYRWSLITLSSLFLKLFKLGALTTSSGRLFQLLTTRSP